jgi:hypothetical protein
MPITRAYASAAQPGNAFLAGKNKLLNGDFFINQRNFSSTTTNNDYGFDRWKFGCSDGTVTYSAQTFTPGSAPVAGYEARNFARINTTGQTLSSANATFRQPIEDVRNFAGQTATLSFWAKSASGTPKIAIEIQQAFGDSGSPSASVNTYAGQVTISTTWTRYSITVAVPSISGKTLGTTPNSSQISPIFWLSAGSNFDSRTGTLGIQTNTFDIWGVQFEAGSVATPFQTATGTLAGELAACQRYYYRITPNGVNSTLSALGAAGSTTGAVIVTPTPVTLRTNPSSIDYSTLSLIDAAGNNTAITALALSGNTTSGNMVNMDATVASGLTAQRPYWIRANASTSAYLGFSSEL